MIGRFLRRLTRKPGQTAKGKDRANGQPAGQTAAAQPQEKKPYHRVIRNADPALIAAMGEALRASDFRHFNDLFAKIGREAFTDLRKTVQRADQARTSRPVFIAGVHRSGTTLLESLVHARFDVRRLRAKVPENEGQFLQDVMADEVVYGGPGLFAFFAQMHADPIRDPVEAAAIRTTLLEEWESFAEGDGSVLLEKTPANIVRIPYLRSVFADARFVIMVRDPRAVVLSTMKWNRSPKDVLFMNWCAAHAAAIKAADSDCLIVRYEDLCADTEAVLDRIGRFAGLDRRPEDASRADRFADVINSNQAYIDRFGTMADDIRRRIVLRPWDLFGYDLSANFD